MTLSEPPRTTTRLAPGIPLVGLLVLDRGPADATAWLFEHGAACGLCQIYRNEPWHDELRPQAVDRGCPPRYADPTHDPRMRS
ncbi:MAG TPA: hypothetical protein VFN57_12815 [Thermomicrobiaceae bacterium]|nr:hypothetical protein [Thermomicrobiaceae bacterium]